MRTASIKLIGTNVYNYKVNVNGYAKVINYKEILYI